MNDSLFAATKEALERLRQDLASGKLSPMHVSPYTQQLPLSRAIRHGNAAACRLLLAAGANPDRDSLLDTSPAWAAVRALHGQGLPAGARAISRREFNSILKVLKEFGATFDASAPGRPAEQGKAYPRLSLSALHYAAQEGDHATVTMLSELGASMDEWVIDDEAGGIPRRALDRALGRGNQDMVVTLLRNGASDEFLGSTTKGYGPAVGCVLSGLDRVFEYYVRERGADLAERWDGRTLLQLAKTAVMREKIRTIKTELAVAGVINVCSEAPRNGGGQTIMSGQAEKRGATSLSPL